MYDPTVASVLADVDKLYPDDGPTCRECGQRIPTEDERDRDEVDQAVSNAPMRLY